MALNERQFNEIRFNSVSIPIFLVAEDSATGTETLQVLLKDIDNAEGTEVSQIYGFLYGADSGVGQGILSTLATLRSIDSASGTEVPQIYGFLEDIDNAAGDDDTVLYIVFRHSSVGRNYVESAGSGENDLEMV